MGKRMTAKQYRGLGKGGRKSKYNNKKIERDGHIFDSIAEYRYYCELKLREKANDILFYRLQPRYRLMDPFEKDGKKHRAIDYVADFEIHHVDGSIEVIDVKGVQTQVFRIKFKMFHEKYPHKLTLVKWDKGRFVEL